MFGALLAFGTPRQLAVTIAIVAALGIPHGHAHGVEAPAAYAAGFVLATGMLHGLGAAGSLTLRRVGLAHVTRLAGASVALAGVARLAV